MQSASFFEEGLGGICTVLLGSRAVHRLSLSHPLFKLVLCPFIPSFVLGENRINVIEREGYYVARLAQNCQMVRPVHVQNDSVCSVIALKFVPLT